STCYSLENPEGSTTPLLTNICFCNGSSAWVISAAPPTDKFKNISFVCVCVRKEPDEGKFTNQRSDCTQAFETDQDRALFASSQSHLSRVTLGSLLSAFCPFHPQRCLLSV